MTAPSVFRTTANIAGNGTLESLSLGGWPDASVISDPHSLHNSGTDTIELPAGWYDIRLSVQHEDADFTDETDIEIRIGKATISPLAASWGRGVWRWEAQTTVPKGAVAWYVETVSGQCLAIGIAQTSGSAKDFSIEVQVIPA